MEMLKLWVDWKDRGQARAAYAQTANANLAVHSALLAAATLAIRCKRKANGYQGAERRDHAQRILELGLSISE